MPPGAPAPTMKSLDQIEPRTPIPASPAVPVTGPHFNITTPGSYYLTGNVVVSSGDAIRITSNDVTLDLNGFRISSTLTGSGLGTAISIPGSFSRLTVRNGFIVSGTTVVAGGAVTGAGFIQGIYSSSSINQALVENVHVTGVTSDGIFLDTQGIVRDCTVRNCGTRGIVADNVTNSSADNCGQTGITGRDISNSSGTGNTVVGISCSGNAINCTATSISGTGLSCNGNVSNSTGFTTSTASNTYGIAATGTASYCRGRKDAGIAIFANIAIGCTVSGTGTVSSPQKFLGTP